ncbi:hypothetical protein [Pelosinus sp. UFO1]|uniref:hypothetical protein n=1 Tax=Pelosinus sp. UFO1 TaxID=484770 RepID=UPI0004D19C62|nr:hypothetical protein [Pelosinus sp. UFO1]AIF51229.1 hypothetical protein UFO1_1678 [Pelosinus sp. UFO1]
MKRIALFILALLFLLSPTTFAQEETTYNGDYFTVTFPGEEWIISNDGKQGFLLARRQHGYPIITIEKLPIWHQNIDDVMLNAQKHTSYLKVHIKDLILEECGATYIDNRDARWDLYTSISRKRFYLSYYVNSSQYYYRVDVSGDYSGDYNEIKAEKEIIDKIVSSIKILK